MLEYRRGNMLAAPAEALVNAVNCVGVEGRGLALQFREAYPAASARYRAACADKTLQIGVVLSVAVERPRGPAYVLYFPTKKHWRSPAKLEYIDQGLPALVAEVRRLGIASVAIPPLGCGLGGLAWADVKPRLEAAFAPLEEVRVLVYEPAGGG